MPQSLPRPDSPTTQRRAAVSGGQPRQVMAAAGAWLRESDPEGHEEAAIAIASIEPARLLEVASGIDAGACGEALARATEGAFEVAMEDDEEERCALAESCMEALAVRDEAESTLVAMSFALQRMQGDGQVAGALEATAAVREALREVDAVARARSRPLTSVNAQRREHMERLSEEHRGAAWWFTHLATSEHDGLVEALAGREAPVGAAAARDAARATLPRRGDAFGGALRALELAPEPGADDPGARWARAEAERSASAATAVTLTRSLRVEDLDVDSLDVR